MAGLESPALPLHGTRNQFVNRKPMRENPAHHRMSVLALLGLTVAVAVGCAEEKGAKGVEGKVGAGTAVSIYSLTQLNYLDKTAAEPGARVFASGLIMQELRAGTGESPTVNDKVKVSYEGRLIYGTVFDTSKSHGGALVFPVLRTIPCWIEALPHMKVGEESRLSCPANLADGISGRPPMIRPGAVLVFDIELLAINP